MDAATATERRVLPGSRVGARCAPSGFAVVTPLSACRTLLAVGTIAPQLVRSDVEAARSQIRSVVGDRAMVDGHDAWTLLHRTNAAPAMAGLGRVDALALLSRAGDAPPAVTGVGRPLPLVVTPDHLSAPVEGCVTLGEGWAVVLGSADPTGSPFSGLLPPGDVRTAVSLCDEHTSPVHLSASRTLLAVIVSN
ncbi:MAG TPA: hypothetical protein VGI06_07835 [Acidimicrobiales bacterium]|jgi:hypothetical protein